MSAVKSRSGIVTFFLRIAGKAPTQTEEHERFRRNLQLYETHNRRLDDIIEDLERINETAKRKNKQLERCADSVRPPKGTQDDGREEKGSEGTG
jgi:hypothetical protein